ncbi:DUF4296 domain-containing protein [Pedobacter heparinus]|uniref:DUF4296 domain-containing protein n=1 Tax=Pedobacter heparinus TaxID=984 RepID=UPI00292D2414|nr:DUF4296 domain-containing protein [Pedobacter heparinus]
MRKILYILIVFFSISGCKPGIPKDIIQPDDMAMVLHDIHLTDGLVNNVGRPDSAKIIAAAYYKGIYKKYNIDSALYARSMAYYYDDPKALNAIYIKVTGKLGKERDVIVKADSLMSANEVLKIRRRALADSTRKADSLFWSNFLLRDTARSKDLPIEHTEVIKLKMRYKGPKDLK